MLGHGTRLLGQRQKTFAHCRNNDWWTSICASFPTPIPKGQCKRDKGCLHTQWDAWQKKKLKLRPKSFITGSKSAWLLPRGRHYYSTLDSKQICLLFWKEILSLSSKVVCCTALQTQSGKALFIKHAETQETHRELSPNNIYPLLLQHCLGFWQILPWVYHSIGHFDESDPQKLEPNPFTLPQQHLIKVTVHRTPSHSIGLGNSPTHSLGPSQLNKYHKPSGSTLESHVAFSLNFCTDLSSWPKALVQTQQSVLTIVQTPLWPAKRKPRALTSCITTLASELRWTWKSSKDEVVSFDHQLKSGTSFIPPVLIGWLPLQG